MTRPGMPLARLIEEAGSYRKAAQRARAGASVERVYFHSAIFRFPSSVMTADRKLLQRS